MGAGKSTVGAEVARRLGLPFRDVDRGRIRPGLGQRLARHLDPDLVEKRLRHGAGGDVDRGVPRRRPLERVADVGEAVLLCACEIRVTRPRERDRLRPLPLGLAVGRPRAHPPGPVLVVAVADDERGLHRETNRAGGIEGGVSNGEEIVVRAAMKPLPTLMRPLRSVDLDTGEAADALVERSDVSAVEALAVVAEAAVAWELACAAREKFGGDALGDFVGAWRAYLERVDWTAR